MGNERRIIEILAPTPGVEVEPGNCVAYVTFVHDPSIHFLESDPELEIINQNDVSLGTFPTVFDHSESVGTSEKHYYQCDLRMADLQEGHYTFKGIIRFMYQQSFTLTPSEATTVSCPMDGGMPSPNP